MDGNSMAALCAIILLVILSAYFSATETAYTSMSRIKMKNAASDGDAKAKKVLKLSDNYDKLLTTILIGNNIANITMTAVSTTLFIKLYGSHLGPTYSTIIVTLIVLIFAEISPKTLAKEAPESFAKFAEPMAHGIMVVLTPLNWLFVKWKKLLVKIFKVGDERTITEDELITLVDEAEKEGGIEAGQSELIQNAIEFNDLEAEEVMIPRVDVVAIDLDLTKDEVAEIFKNTGFSRIPVYDDDMDSILGVLNQKDFHNYIAGTGNTISDFVKPVVFVAGSMKIALLLKKMQALKTHMAIVVDEYGGTEGLLTMEDIIEELVGEIYDEHDAIMSQEVTELQNGSYRVMCNANLPKVFDYFGIEDEVDANTVNGWVVLCLDKLPEKGDTFEYRTGHRIFKGRVTKATNKKALEINIAVEHVSDEETEEKKSE